jgi:hypothetical protein
MKNDQKFIFDFLASQPPTTIPPPTTEAVETTTQKKIVNLIPQTTTLYTIHMMDKGKIENKFL